MLPSTAPATAVDADAPGAAPLGTPASAIVVAGLGALLLVSTLRYFAQHPLNGVGVWVLGLAIACGAAALASMFGPAGSRIRTLGVLAATALWLPLAVLAPSYAWCAFALFFAVHLALPRRSATLISAVIVVAVSAGLFIMSQGADLGLVLGPFVGGLVMTLAFLALDRAREQRLLALGELLQTREQLARTEREAGALAERGRVARELHDTVVQRTASALLLLESAEISAAEGPVTTARAVLRESLAETRGLMQGLTRPRAAGESFADTLRGVATQFGAGFTVIGADSPYSTPDAPLEPDPQTAHALIRVAQEALTNTRKHAGGAAQCHLTLTYFGDTIGLDAVDAGPGFDASQIIEATTGFGLRAMRWRIADLGGSFTIRSSPEAGTTIAVVVPMRAEGQT